MSNSARDCVSCKKLLIPPTANFCAHCGFPQAHPGNSSEEEDAPRDAPITESCCLMPQDFIELENDKKQQNQVSTNLPKVLLPVLNVPREKSIKVQFNAVIPLTIWEWKEGESSVYMRFGHRDIGSWKRDIGPCALHRGVGNGLFVVQHKISLDYKFLKDNQNGLSYKYVVYSPRSNSIGHQFEFLHGAPPCESLDSNRLLKIPQNKLKPGGYYRQFDTVILPDIKSNETKSTDNKRWKSLDFSNLSAFVIPSPAAMRSLCLDIHLHAMKGIIINGIYSQDFSIQNVLTAFLGLFNCVCVQWIEHKGKEVQWVVEGLDIYIKEWFVSVVHTLLTTKTLKSHLRVVSGVLTAIFLRNIMKCNFIDITEEIKIGLLQVMSLSVVNGRTEFKFLQEIFKTAEIKKIVLDALLYYLSVELKEDTHVITVINALPLYHFLSGLSVPNQVSLKEAPCVLNLVALNTLIDNNPSIFEMCCSTIFQLVQLDSQMLVLIPYFNCLKNLKFICEVLPIELSIVWLKNLQSHVPNIYLSSVSGRKMEQHFVKPVTCIQQRIITVEIKKFSILSCYSEAAIFLMKSFKKNLDSSKNSELLVVSVVSLLLHILYRAKKFAEETNDQWSLCQKLRHSIQGLLMDWVMCPDVVGGSFFGGEIKENYQEIRKKEQELKFWESILTLEFPAKDMKNELDALVVALVSDRISNIPTTHLIVDAFVYVETQKEIHHSLRSIFFTKACGTLGVKISTETKRLSSNLVVELICELAKQSPTTTLCSVGIPTAVKSLDIFQATDDEIDVSYNEEIKKRKEEYKNNPGDFTLEKKNEQSSVVTVGKEGKNFNQPSLKERDGDFNALVPILPTIQKHGVLHPLQNKKMTVQFNAVIRKDIWKWEEGRSEVYIRFGHIMLGGWKLDIGPCILHRDAGNGFHAIRYDMSIDIDFIKSVRIGLPYKYTVYSPLIKITKHQYEQLYGAPPYQSTCTNRLLKVPKEKLYPGGYYRQFDTMILPDTKVKTVKGTFKRAWDFILGVEPDDPTAITVPTTTLMRSQCMEIHLQPTKDILLSGDFKSKLDVLTNECVNLIRCAYLQWVEHRGGDYCWEIQDIHPFLMDLVEFFLVDLNKQRDSAYHTVTSAVFLDYCLHKLRKFYSVPISVDLCIKLLQTMNLSYINGEKELSFLMSMIGDLPETRIGIVNALIYCLRTVIASENPDSAIVILKALPLYHFLCDLSVPYQKSCVPLNKITWGDTLLLIDKLQSTLWFNSGFVQKHKDDIQQLLQFDSKLLYIIPYVCPLEDTVILCDMLPIELAIVWLIERLNSHSDIHNLRLSSVTDYKMNHCFKLPLANILQRIYEKKINNFDVLVWYSDATVLLHESSRDKLNFSINAKILVKSMISLYLHILFKAKLFQDQANSQDILCQRLTLSVRELLKDWVAHKDVIGGSFFGASLKYAGTSYQELRKEDDELEFWKELLFIKFPANEMKYDFEVIVLELVSDRVSKIPSPEVKINLFINVEHRKEIADSFRNIFLTKAIEALDSMLSKRTMIQSIQRLSILLDLNSERILKLISKIIKKRYPDFLRTQEIPFSEMLDWEMWPGILKISYAQVWKDIRESGEWILIVACAVTKLEAVCANINSGGITITELNLIRTKQIQMNKLCEVIDKSRITDLKKSIEKRLKEFEHFEKYLMKLKFFFRHVCKILAGKYNLMDELQKNYEDEKINKLCITASDGSCRIVCFPDARPLDPCLDGFFIISSKYSSDIFNRLWYKRLNEQPAAVDSSEIYSLLWQPTLQSCILLLKKLQAGDMTLLEVDDQFKIVYFNKLDKLQKDLINLQHAIDDINHLFTSDSTWIKNAVVHIGQYWDLCGYRETAEAFLKIRDTLNLTGDFVIVERVALKVSSNHATLSTIDHSVVDAGRFLQEYATDPAKRECLEVFAICQNIVKWIRNETKDLKSLFNFVSCSVAGREGSMTADKLLFLYTVGSGFSPLIYKLSKDASCQKLQDLCKTLWMALETTPYLPDLMKSCERDIDWYRSFKEKHKTKIN